MVFMETTSFMASKLKRLRHLAGLSQADLAAKLNISRSCLANYENSKRMPDSVMTAYISRYFGVSEEYFKTED